MILRELLFKLGVDFESKGARDAESAVNGLIGNFQALGGVVATAGAFKVFESFVDRASEVEETLVRTRGLFGQSSQSMIDWSEKLAGSIGRDGEALLDMGAQVGQLAQGFGATEEESSRLAQGATELATNMASFLGQADPEAMQSITGALAGMGRGVKRLGIDVSDAGLEEYRLALGIRKSVKAMSDREKVMLRYRMLQEKLQKMDGAAAKSTERYAGAVKALGVEVENVQEALGAQLLPGATSMVNILREGVAWFAKLAEGTHIAQAALIGVSLVIGSMLWPHLVRLLVVGGPLVLAFAAFALVIDDVIAAFTGGESTLIFFAQWFDDMEKEGFPGWTKALEGPVSMLNRLRDVLGADALLMTSFWDSVWSGDWGEFKNAVDGISDSFLSWAENGKLLKYYVEYVKWALDSLGTAGSAIGKFLTPKALAGGGMMGGSVLGAPAPAASAAPQKTNNKTFNMTINQQPGEDTEFFARKVAEEIDKRDAARDEALYYEFLPQGAQ